MAARSKIARVNLLPQEEFAGTTIGRILRWAVGALRIIVIAVEVVVMGAFLSRFWLDARVTDLTDEIDQKTAIVESQAAFEQTFRNTQDKLRVLSTLDSQPNIDPIFASTTTTLPIDVALTSVSMAENKIQIRATALAENSIAQFVANLESQSPVSNLALIQAATRNDNPFIDFTLEGSFEK